jgi:NitT/TauT family transport system ATP-binding protein
MAAGSAAPPIRLEGVTKSFRGREGDLVPALEGVSLDVPSGAIGCIVGPTGCGKTTLLRLAAGLEAPDAGRIEVGGGAKGQAPLLGYLTQGHTLFPWLTAGENVALPLRLRGLDARTASERSREVLANLGLAPHADLYPYELSGGMQQRAALGRLLASETACWLLDEPFGALDEKTRHHLQDLLLALAAARGITVLFVTHAIDEAVYLADREHVLSAAPGRVVATLDLPEGRPRDRLSHAFSGHLESIRRTLKEAIG